MPTTEETADAATCIHPRAAIQRFTESGSVWWCSACGCLRVSNHDGWIRHDRYYSRLLSAHTPVPHGVLRQDASPTGSELARNARVTRAAEEYVLAARDASPDGAILRIQTLAGIVRALHNEPDDSHRATPVTHGAQQSALEQARAALERAKRLYKLGKNGQEFPKVADARAGDITSDIDAAIARIDAEPKADPSAEYARGYAECQADVVAHYAAVDDAVEIDDFVESVDLGDHVGAAKRAKEKP